MRRKGRPKRQKPGKSTAGRRPGRPGRPPKKRQVETFEEGQPPRPSVSNKQQPQQQQQQRVKREPEDPLATKKEKVSTVLVVDDGMSEGLHVTTSQVHALGALVACRECGESVRIGVRPTTKGMISEFTVACNVCEDTKSTNTPNLIRERKRKREKKDAVLQKTENINYAHVAAFLDNGLGYSGLRHYCKYFNSRCLNEATFIVYARQVISDVVADTEDSLQYSASIVREVFKSQLETDGLVDITVAFTTTYHQWGSDFCLVAGAVIELTTGLVLDYDVANMYCHVCKINAKKIVSMSPVEMTEWFNKHQDTCEIREWCDELDHDAEEGVREIEPKYLECFIAKKIWARSIEKFGFRYTTLIHESDEKIHEELSRAGIYDDIPILIDSATSCFSRRKSEHARTSFQTKLKAKCPRERVQTKDRILYVYAMSIPEYNKFAISSNIKLRQLVKEMEGGVMEEAQEMMQDAKEQQIMPNQLQLHEVQAIKQLVANGEEEEDEEEEQVQREIMEDEEEEEEGVPEEQEVDDPEELEEDEEEEGMLQGEDEEELLEEDEALAQQRAEEEERRRLEEEWGDEEEEEEETLQQIRKEVERGARVQRARIEEISLPLQIKEESKEHIAAEIMAATATRVRVAEEEEEEEEEEMLQEEDQPAEEEDEEQIEVDDEEELEQLRLDEEEAELQEQMQEEEDEGEEEEEEAPPPPPPQPQSPAKQIKKQEESQGPRTEEVSKSATQGLRQFRPQAITKAQQEEAASRKRKQEDEDGAPMKRSKQEETMKSTQEGTKNIESKPKESDKEEGKQAERKEGMKDQAMEKQKVENRLQPKDNQPKQSSEDKQKTDVSQQKERKEEKQKPEASKQSEKRDNTPKTDSKPSEGKDATPKTEERKSDKSPRKEEERSTTEKREAKTVTSQDEAKEREASKDVTKPQQREEASKTKVEVTQKADMGVKQPEKADTGKQIIVVKKVPEGEGKATPAATKVVSAAAASEAEEAKSMTTKVTMGNTTNFIPTAANSTAAGTDKT